MCRDPDKMLKNFRAYLDDKLYEHLKRELNNKYPVKFIGDTTVS